MEQLPHVFLLVEDSLKAKHHGVRLKGVLVEQDGEVRVASVRHELIGDVITGFLKNNRMEPSTGHRTENGGGSCAPGLGSTEEQGDGIGDARGHYTQYQCVRARQVLAWPNLTMERTRARGFKGPLPVRGSAPMAWWVPARAALCTSLVVSC